MENRIKDLIRKFNDQQITESELKEMDQLIASGQITISDVSELDRISDQIVQMESPAPSASLDDRFYQMLALEKGKQPKPSFNWKKFLSWPELAPKLAFASVALVIGVAAGYMFRPTAADSDPKQMKALTQQVTELKEMMMLSLLEKESATERLKAVSLTEDMDDASQKVTGALLQTLNQDENVNVRLAALEALKPYVKDSQVRQELIRAIAKQESPLVQVALAELMAAIQEKSSVKELEKIIQSEKTPDDVKSRIEQSIKVLI
ncbi:MAG: HEAT repeat domain-containing protein [Bacteroidota bacterium]